MDTAADRVRRDLDLAAPTADNIRALLSERDELAALIAGHPRCKASTPVQGSRCVHRLRGHTGPHHTTSGWTW